MKKLLKNTNNNIKYQETSKTTKDNFQITIKNNRKYKKQKHILF